MKEPPRIAHLLRVRHHVSREEDTEDKRRLEVDASLSDFSELVLQRKMLFDQQHGRRRNDAVQKSNSSFSWSCFATSTTASDSELRSIRRLFNSFLCKVATLMGTPTSEELHSGAMAAYRILSNAPSESNALKLCDLLAPVFGLVPRNTATELQQLGIQLLKWKKSHLKPQEVENSQQEFLAQQPSCSSEEYGAEWAPSMSYACDFVSGKDNSWIPQRLERKMSQTHKCKHASYLSPTAAKLETRVRPSKSVEDHIDCFWLERQCKSFLSTNDSVLSVNELSQSLLESLQSERSDEELQSDLFDLLGAPGTELIQLLLKRRSDIRVASRIEPPSEKHEEPLKKAIGTRENASCSRHSDGPVLTSDGRHEGVWLDEQAIVSLPKAPSPAPSILQLAPSGNSSEYVPRSALPEGTVRHNTERYEEIVVPPVETRKPIVGELIPVCALDELTQQVFQGYEYLNRVQSEVFEAAYNSNENLLICAPTGSGKTNVALMTILHEINLHFVGNTLQKDDFKIVYVAPMKALAQEITHSFRERLGALGIMTRELTGDMQLSKREISETQIIVTTPEKWDVVTRKSADNSLNQLVRLLIIDEVHLIHEDRGPVLEILVARTLRQVESSQSMIRIVGLSATLPNYRDIGLFLRANQLSGLFHFDASFRPVSLSQEFVGIKEKNPFKQKLEMNRVCFEKVLRAVRQGHKVLVFVHSRRDTVSCAQALRLQASQSHNIEYFLPDQAKKNFFAMSKAVSKSKNRELREIFPDGFAIHHAGMLRADRTLVENLFRSGLVSVLVCTATLAWGINMPAHTVVIRGTQLYSADRGGYVDLGMLDVMQIFGRAGRPQYDTSGEGIIITAYEKLSHYLSVLNHQLPIESRFISKLADHLNAEVVLGTVGNVREAIKWLSYTYLYIRMMKNPLVYGLSHQDKEMDPMLEETRRKLIITAARDLDRAKMIRFDEQSGNMAATSLGRVASHFYIETGTMSLFGERITEHLAESNMLDIVCHSKEFSTVKCREEEMQELEMMKKACIIPLRGASEDTTHLKAFLSHHCPESFTLISDSNYIIQNMSRILRGLFEMVHQRGWCTASLRLLTLCKMAVRYLSYLDWPLTYTGDRQLWSFSHPLAQFSQLASSCNILALLEKKKLDVETLLDMSPKEIGAAVNHPHMGPVIKKCARHFPYLELSASIQPITRSILRVHLSIDPQFEWSDHAHGSVEPFWIWVEDSDNAYMYHSEYFLLYKQQVLKREDPIVLVFTIPVFEPLPAQYYVRAVSDRWLDSESLVPLSFQHLILPHEYPPHTDLLNLQPLPLSALDSSAYAGLFSFSYFNPIQTQVFHVCYHSDYNVLLGSPTGSGKTVAAELCMLRVFRHFPNMKVVYIAPLKALVRERIRDWKCRFENILGKHVVELTGDFTPNIKALQVADIVCTTPEKWDGVSRSWKTRCYVQSVGLIVIDEIHLLGEKRGAVLEVIVSRMRYISSQTESPVRVIGLSTAVANAQDLVEWLGLEGPGIFNFRPAVRPVPCEVHIEGYPGKHYCPRMALMNKPAYSAITIHSPTKPVLVFVSSRRQTRLTALDLISCCTADEQPRQWLHMGQEELDNYLACVKEGNLKHTLQFGVAIHHAGLCDSDREIAEELFIRNKIQILVSTSTLAWGVNLPAHLVVIKGTEYYDGKTRKYIDFPVTDVLQMMGRAGRPQFDHVGKAVILVHEPKKNFYKKFLYEPFPVESHLREFLPNHFNAEVVSGTICTKQDAVDYLTWTYFFRRLVKNPSYYGLENQDVQTVNSFLSHVVDEALHELEDASCISVSESNKLIPLSLGRIASYYYLNYTTVKLFRDSISRESSFQDLLGILCGASEYDELPVRHNEDKLNSELAEELPMAVDQKRMDDPHTKAFLLFQAHFCNAPLPITDYVTDTKSVLDQAVRVIQGIVDVCAESGWLLTSLSAMHLLECVFQGRWMMDSTLLSLPFVDSTIVTWLNEELGVDCIPELFAYSYQQLRDLLSAIWNPSQIDRFLNALRLLPQIDITVSLPAARFATGEEVQVRIDLVRANKCVSQFAFTPRFPKVKQEGWWLVIGTQGGDLLALRRVLFRSRTSVILCFSAPPDPGRHTLTVYLMSDCYLGLNQQVDLCLVVSGDL